jgi:16S rRNA processing protein RimM
MDTGNAPEWIAVGRVERPHGTGGEVLVRVMTDRDERFRAGSGLFIEGRGGDSKHPVTVASARSGARGLLVRLEGCDSREQAQQLAGAMLFIPSSEVAPPEEGSYYAFQLEGCEVFAGSRRLGVVAALSEAPANPYLEVEPGAGGEPVTLPFVREVILSVDLERRHIHIPEDFLE